MILQLLSSPTSPRSIKDKEMKFSSKVSVSTTSKLSDTTKFYQLNRNYVALPVCFHYHIIYIYILYAHSNGHGYKLTKHKVKAVVSLLLMILLLSLTHSYVRYYVDDVKGNTQAAPVGVECSHIDTVTNTIEQQDNKKPDSGDDDNDDVSSNNDHSNEPSGHVGDSLPDTQIAACESKACQSTVEEASLKNSGAESNVADEDRNVRHIDYSRDNRNGYLLPESTDQNQVVESESEPRRYEDYPYDTLAKATGYFDRKKRKEGGALIAAGSFGEVFYAVLDEHRLAAVKRLKAARSEKQSSMRLSKRQFTNELTALTMCPRHQNVVNLLGMSSDGPMLCLVYEYVGGGTLSEYLSADQTTRLLWHDRVKISTGVARALHHIHTSCSPPIIHRDVKSCNILLLSDLTAVLTDFGLSCHGEFTDEPDASFVESGSTTVGTRCYMPPEAFKGIFSTRSDIYSFGMVLFEVLTGLPPFSKTQKTDLITYLRDCEKEGTELSSMADPSAMWPSDVAASLFELGRCCSNYDSHARPVASEVLSHLDALI